MNNSSNEGDLWFTEKHRNVIGHTFRIKNVLFQSKSQYQTIDIFDTPFYGKMLLLDDLVMTTERDEFIYHEMITHIPLLAHPNPRNILVIGGGDGGTVREVLRHPSVERVVLCEIDGEVVEACKRHLPSIAEKLDDPRVEICLEDAVKYVEKIAQQKENLFDVILIDSTDPIGAGEGLFTTDFYKNVSESLQSDGIMANQSESPWSDSDLFQNIYKKLQRVFPVTRPYMASVPSYPGSIWSWTFCSNSLQPKILNDEFAAEIEKQSRYFNRDLYQASFALPNYVKKMLL